MNSADRLLSILTLFTVDKPLWTVEDAAREIGVSLSQTYRYFNSLAKAGLLDSATGPGIFSLGPAFLEYDRQIRLCDPMLTAARPVMVALARHAPATATVLLCRRYRDRVMCVHQEIGAAPQAPVGFERGRPMPILRGASSKVILANLPARAVKRIHAEHQAEIAELGLGKDWHHFRLAMAEIRKRGYCYSLAEVDPERTGLAAPIFDSKGLIVGSIGMALRVGSTEEGRLPALVTAAARDVEAGMAQMAGAAGAPVAEQADERPRLRQAGRGRR